MDWSFFLLSQSCILFLAADSTTNVEVLNTILGNLSKRSKALLLLRESLFALLGSFVLYPLLSGLLYSLQTPACAATVVGGCGVMFTGMRAILRNTQASLWSKIPSLSQSPKVAPIALPLMIGPSWLCACAPLAMQQLPFSIVCTLLCLSWLMMTITTIVLQTANKAGSQTIIATQTILGLAVVIVGAQLLVSGLQQTFL
ncbi:MarC family protein [Chlamydia trachomatis]|uniref:MarC family protein n=1 Tax=Chlamydia trachomatis TaxID=813 RepID=UPI0001B46F79|nr:MarC family protein [Chlamydia trachomatis]ADH17665.1 putative integral membrane protein [Chlamydia trachomatis E/150]ADH21357.1 putative integral membrane protein [Chlamydia trachomatis E/11023]AGR96191.1 putative integral membrane protein [Chlamydia trachomatis RC-F(s)/852]AGR99907.1 putative integral membrane protein [Chlamydia trachomatis RC-F(s)/342]AGT64819.1 MarC family transcriptional regulator [Chlamydia trachomatis]